jgi:tRNA uridine 5-carbamoylmethylation protein Kti12
MNIAYIMRGIPGSGKSTIAKHLAGDDGVIHSTDDYFYIDGEYRFDETRLREFHDKNFAAFCNSLRERKPVVICDNTNIKRIDAKPYADAAKAAGYVVVYVVMPIPSLEEALRRNVHNLSPETIQKMMEEFEV